MVLTFFLGGGWTWSSVIQCEVGRRHKVLLSLPLSLTLSSSLSLSAWALLWKVAILPQLPDCFSTCLRECVFLCLPMLLQSAVLSKWEQSILDVSVIWQPAAVLQTQGHARVCFCGSGGLVISCSEDDLTLFRWLNLCVCQTVSQVYFCRGLMVSKGFEALTLRRRSEIEWCRKIENSKCIIAYMSKIKTENRAKWTMEHHPSLSTRTKRGVRTQPASQSNLPFSFMYFIAVGTSETADRREVSSPCAVWSPSLSPETQPQGLCLERSLCSPIFEP